ncbi:hypothetical protein O2N63_15180 [Aliiroseovarius sp. KMU-50]|uniref:Cobalt chelatase n=1 Tax=Aliiroseovarius salicola TaxID=3009082 RepID=A0ABT4W4I9_9RHOB|nr:hypothetical protein [Aliiroseovarius sp. KMU-50]MDA5095430.1 hypothetical protein [Aliiroseovarius sp. KMU-50]
MDYKAAGAPKPAKGTPRHREHNERGSEKNPYQRKDQKAELLARMKAAAQKKAATDKGK